MKNNFLLHPLRSSLVYMGIFGMSLSLFFISWESADAASNASCALKSGPASSLKQYLSNLDKELNTLKTKASSYTCNSADGTSGATGEAKADWGQMVGFINRWVNVDNPWITGRFWFDGIGERPYEVTRDLKLLTAKQKNITQLFTTLSKDCSIDQSYEEGKTLGKRLGEILTNHIKIIDTYKRTVIGDTPQYTEYDSITPSSFNTSLNSDYSPKVVQSCMGESSFDAIAEKISNIGKIGGSIKTGIKSWQDGTDLLLGKLDDKKAKQKERALLAKELARQGVGGDQAKRILKNLENYNNSSGIGAVGIGGFVSDIKKIWADIYNIFAETVSDIELAWQKSNELTMRFNRQEQLKALKTDLGAEISEMYATSKAIIGTESSISDDIIAQLIEARISLKWAKEQLKDSAKVATEACESTNKGVGTCK